jgi:hypothetical protein
VAVLLVWIYTHSRSSGRTLLGAVAPPGVGSSTTLLITDIQVRHMACLLRIVGNPTPQVHYIAAGATCNFTATQF